MAVFPPSPTRGEGEEANGRGTRRRYNPKRRGQRPPVVAAAFRESPRRTRGPTPEGPFMDAADELTPAVQDYLKAIHSLGGTERLVSPLEIAARLQVRAPSVTGMLKRLAEAGSIHYEVRQGARLT